MDGKKPVLLYLLINFAVLIIVVYAGFAIGNFLREKSANKDPVEQVKAEEPVNRDTTIAKTIWVVGGVVFFIMIIAYIILKAYLKE